jgi:hypothetical protein
MLVAGCQRSRMESSCEELQHSAPPGVTLANNEQRCAELLAFANVAVESYGMDFTRWLTTVPSQPVKFVHETIFALTERSWPPVSFQRVPAAVPCGKAMALDDATWTGSALSRVLSSRPEQVYVSLAVEISADRATIRVFQDFDCDQKLGVTEVTGRFKQGLSPFTGGWQLEKATYAEIDE